MNAIKKKILVVDDDPVQRQLYAYALEDEFALVTAVDGQDGVEQFLATRPDMVFLDLHMPRLDGIGALAQIRQHDSQVPVYIVTQYSPQYMTRLNQVRESGLAFELAAKPLSISQIELIARAKTGSQIMMAIELYTSGRSSDMERLEVNLASVLQMQIGANFSLSTTDVLKNPEKAAQDDVFATPMLLRRSPLPIIKIMGRFDQLSKAVSILRDWNNQQEGAIFIL